MRRVDLIKLVADKAEISQVKAAEIMDIILDNITLSLKAGETIKFNNFGAFKIKERKEKIGRNLKTGKQIVIPARSQPVFKASKNLIEIVN